MNCPEFLRTLERERPSQGLVDLDTAKSWLGLSGTVKNDSILESLLPEISDFICGPESEIAKCFREWMFEDIWKGDFEKDMVIPLKYPVVKEVTRVNLDDSILDADKYEVNLKGIRKSSVKLLSRYTDGEVKIQYTTGGEIPRKINLLCKMLVFELFQNRGSQVESAIKENPFFRRVLNAYRF